MTGQKLVKSLSKAMVSWKATGKMKRKQIERLLTAGCIPATWGRLMNADESMLSTVKKISSLVAGGIFLRLRKKVYSMTNRLFRKLILSLTHKKKGVERHIVSFGSGGGVGGGKKNELAFSGKALPYLKC